ncbi:MAG: cell division protein SepF [Oscillospiraceae bacterium]|nr:cell division protein SepF [Oscillospiraceae bacterium]
MSFWDNVKKFAQPYGDEEYDDYDDEEMDEFEEEEEVAPRSGRRMPSFGASASSDSAADFSTPSTAPASSSFSGQILNMSSGKQEVVLFHARAFDDAAKAADELRNKRAIILNMENVDKALTRRVVDFLSGCVYAVDGKVKKIAQSTYLFCPHSMDIVGDLESFQNEAESYI